MIQQSLNVHPSQLIAVHDSKRDFWHVSAQSLAQSYKGGMDIQWGQYHGEYESNLNLLELPSYAFDVKNYWINYEGNWSLTKGRNVTQTQTPTSDTFKTTTLQVIESENHQGRQATVVFSSNLAEKHLQTAVRGHSVNGTFLCPSSVYGDMAIGAAAYIFSKTHPNEKTSSFDVYNMEVIKPLRANDDGKDQWIQITATKQKDDEFVSVSISSHESETLLKHASCVVKHGSGADWMSKWARNAYFVKARIENLIEGIAQRSTQQISRPMAYRLFSNLVTYDKKYQGMERVYLNSDLREAAAEIEFQSAYLDGSFHVSPYWIDSILHISGFILNGSEMATRDSVYISHGWRSMRIARPLSATKRYRNYVRMQETNTRGVMAGDIYVFDGDDIIAVCKGLKFQEIKRKVLDLLLDRQSNSVAAMQGVIKLPTSKIIDNLPIERESRSHFDGILEIIASEAEIGLDELTDNARLVELGIDSLLAMGIVERIRVLLKCADIPSSIFFNFQTVSQLRVFFSNNIGSCESSERETTTHSENVSTGSPITSISGIADEHLSNRQFPEILETILSEELEMPESEIGSSTRFAEIGVDSLMALNTAGMMGPKACKNIDSDFLYDYSSFGDALKLKSWQGNGIEHSESTLISKEAYYGSRQFPQATSVVLQQSPTSNSAIFLFPDGGGSAASYAGLPPIHPSATVYGLISPFVKSPADFNGTMTWIVSLYVGEICRRQKSGPYILGGWSIGGIYAYEAARQLILQGEQVSRLILIDAPCPVKLPPMMLETIDRLEELGTFDGFAGSQYRLPSLVGIHLTRFKS